MQYDRSYYQWQKVVNDMEMDFLLSRISEFESYITRPVSYVLYASDYLGRLDLLAYDTYGEPLLWWVLALANGIDDPFDDALVNTLLRVPDILDVYAFYDEHYQTAVEA